METWKQLAANTPAGPEREAALDQIRERERAFARVQQSEATLFHRLVSGEVLVSEAKATKTIIETLISDIASIGHVVEFGRVAANVPRSLPTEKASSPKDKGSTWLNWLFSNTSEDEEIGEIIVTLHVTVRPSQSLPRILADAAQTLGGPGLVPRTNKATAVYQFPTFSSLIAQEAVEVKNPATSASPRSSQSFHVEYEYNNLFSKFSKRNRQLPDSSVRRITTEVIGSEYRLSEDRSANEYFQDKLAELTLVIFFTSEDDKRFGCRLLPFVNRLVPIMRGRDERRYELQLGEMGEVTERHPWDSVILLRDQIEFEIDLLLPRVIGSKIRKFEGLVSAMPEVNTVCRTVLPGQ